MTIDDLLVQFDVALPVAIAIDQAMALGGVLESKPVASPVTDGEYAFQLRLPPTDRGEAALRTLYRSLLAVGRFAKWASGGVVEPGRLVFYLRRYGT